MLLLIAALSNSWHAYLYRRRKLHMQTHGSRQRMALTCLWLLPCGTLPQAIPSQVACPPPKSMPSLTSLEGHWAYSSSTCHKTGCATCFLLHVHASVPSSSVLASSTTMASAVPPGASPGKDDDDATRRASARHHAALACAPRHRGGAWAVDCPSVLSRRNSGVPPGGIRGAGCARLVGGKPRGATAL